MKKISIYFACMLLAAQICGQVRTTTTTDKMVARQSLHVDTSFRYEKTGNRLKQSDVLGPNLVPNANFANSANWTFASGWVLNNGATYTGSGTLDTLTSSIVLIRGKNYLVSFSLSQNTGGKFVMYCGGSYLPIADVPGTYTSRVIATDTRLFFQPYASFSGSVRISNVSVREITGTSTFSGVASATGLESTSGNIYTSSSADINIGNYRGLYHGIIPSEPFPWNNIVGGTVRIGVNTGGLLAPERGRGVTGIFIGALAGSKSRPARTGVFVGYNAGGLGERDHSTDVGIFAGYRNQLEHSNFGDESGSNCVFCLGHSNFGYYAGHSQVEGFGDNFGHESARFFLTGDALSFGFRANGTARAGTIYGIGRAANYWTRSGSVISLGLNAGSGTESDSTFANRTGTGLIYIGHGTRNQAPNVSYDNSIVIGDGQTMSASNQVTIGNSAMTELRTWGDYDLHGRLKIFDFFPKNGTSLPLHADASGNVQRGFVEYKHLENTGAATGSILQFNGAAWSPAPNPANNLGGIVGRLAFFNTANSVTSANTMYYNASTGYLGFDVPNPTAPLDVNGMIRGRFLTVDHPSTSAFLMAKSGNYKYSISGASYLGVSGTDNDAIHYVYSTGARFRVFASSAERLTVGNNVGINTANPTESLEVTGSIKASTLSGTGNRLVQANATGVLQPSTIEPAAIVTLTTAATGDLSNSYTSPTVVGIRNRPIGTVSPVSGNVLTYDAATGLWNPAAPTSAFGSLTTTGPATLFGAIVGPAPLLVNGPTTFSNSVSTSNLLSYTGTASGENYNRVSTRNYVVASGFEGIEHRRINGTGSTAIAKGAELADLTTGNTTLSITTATGTTVLGNVGQIWATREGVPTAELTITSVALPSGTVQKIEVFCFSDVILKGLIQPGNSTALPSDLSHTGPITLWRYNGMVANTWYYTF